MESYGEWHTDVERVVGDKQVQYVLHQDRECTWEEYLQLIRELNISQYEDDPEQEYTATVNFIAEDKIVGEGWWFEFTVVCCGEPSWYYREHPSLNRDQV